MTRPELIAEILKLTSTDQILIVEAIRNNLAGQLDPVNEVEFKRELDRRAAYVENNPNDASPLSEAMARLRSRR